MSSSNPSSGSPSHGIYRWLALIGALVVAVAAVSAGILGAANHYYDEGYDVGRGQNDEDIRALERTVAELSTKNTQLKKENTALTAKIKDLEDQINEGRVVDITDPHNLAGVPNCFRIRGTYQQDTFNPAHKIWIVAPGGDGLYYPQLEKPVDLLQNGEWISDEIYADSGDGNPVNEQFTYTAVVVSSDKTADLFSELRSEYQGLKVLPDDVKKYDAITVTVVRKVDCK